MAYASGMGLVALTIVFCNLVVLAFRHPRLPRWIGGDFVVMMVAVLLTVILVVTYAAATSQIASSLPPGDRRSVMVGVAASFFVLAVVVSVAMGMRRRLRQAQAGESPFLRRVSAKPITVTASA